MIDVELPDGRVVSVDAPDAQTAASAAHKYLLKNPAAQPSSPSIQGLTTDFLNVGPAMSQGVVPDVSQHMPNLISADTFESDSGEILYRDPASGKLVPTNSATQVAIRDPADNRVKIFARTPETAEGAVVGISRLLTQGLATGAPTVRPGIPLPSLKSATPRASDVFATSKPYYRTFEKIASGTKIPSKTTSQIASRISSALEASNLDVDLAGPVFKAVERLGASGDISLEKLQRIKRVIGRSFASPDKNVRDAASIASGEINKIVAEISPEAGSALRSADQIQSTAYSLQDLQRKEAIAGLRAGRAGYGGNQVNKIRQILTPIAEASIKGRTTGFKPDEIAAIRDIVEGTKATNALRLVGQMSPTKGYFATGGALGTSFLSGSPLPLAAPVVGAAADKLATILTGRQFQQLKSLVARRSPAYKKAVERAVGRYTKAQADFVTNPSRGRFAAYVGASRALSNGLTRDGISITAGDLLRGGTMPARTEEEQQ